MKYISRKGAEKNKRREGLNQLSASFAVLCAFA
jgi:hypothetical protein